MRFFVAILILCLGASEARAISSPIGVSLFPISQNLALGWPWPKERVAGVRVGLIAKNLDVYGIDVGGLANVTSNIFGGIGISGGINSVGRLTMISGLQFAGLANVNMGRVAIWGLQFGGLANVNAGTGYLVGAQIAALKNHSPQSDIYGVQISLVNGAKTVYGVQIGLINVAGALRGVQIGLLNFNLSERPFGFFPGINIGF